MNRIIRIFVILSSVLIASIASAADYPTPSEGDFTIRDFKFQSGETLPELRIHYLTDATIAMRTDERITKIRIIRFMLMITLSFGLDSF